MEIKEMKPTIRLNAIEFFGLAGISAQRVPVCGKNSHFIDKTLGEVERDVLELFKKLNITKDNAKDYLVEIWWCGKIHKVYQWDEIWSEWNNEEEADEKTKATD
jgi:hypothetical protein